MAGGGQRRTLKKRAKPALTASIITSLAIGTGTPADTITWRWPLSKVFAHLHAVAVYNGNATRWRRTDPESAARLRAALRTIRSATPPEAEDDPFALDED